MVHNLHKGFTLVELMVSLFIITLLIGLGGGNLVAYGQRNRETERETHQQSIQDALEQCYALEGNYPQKSLGGDVNHWKQYLKNNYHVIFMDSVFLYTPVLTGATVTSVTVAFQSGP